MSYTYRADVSMQVDLEIEAESYAVAEELIQQYLAPVSDDGRVSIHSNDGITLDNISSDDDPADDD
tara:strand:- start:686 stop:883 length:198 start_codon:yes stop_codon:yes gene_type:complete